MFVYPSSKPLPPPRPPPASPTPPPTPPLPPSKYVVTLIEHSPTPTLSISNAVGKGHSPCNTTFNPSWISLNSQGGGSGDVGDSGGIIVRTDHCDATQGSLSFAKCNLTTGVCDDLDSSIQLPQKTAGTQDPRIIYNPTDEFFYLFAYGSPESTDHCEGGSLCSVVLSRSKTPLVVSTWEHISAYPWHRNGCCTPFKAGSKSTYCIFGEGPSPLPGLGISYTDDISTGKFTQMNWTGGVANNNNLWMEPLGTDLKEIKLEAGTHMMQLSSGDYIHFYAAATPGWVANGNYTAGYIVLAADEPTKIIQRESGQWLIPTFDFETLCDGASDCKYQGERKNVIFLCSATPLPKTGAGIDRFRLFWGGGDGNVGTGVVEVKLK